MDCVYHAYIDHLGWLGETATPADLLYWKTLKWWTHGSRPQYTFGGVVPWIIGRMAGLHGMQINIEHRIYTPSHYALIALDHYRSHFKRIVNIIGDTYYGTNVPKITLAPAIYLCLTRQHAVFSTRLIHDGVPTMAIQLERRQNGR